MPLHDRYRIVNGKGRRLEHYEERDGYELLNLVTTEFGGPGRSKQEGPAAHMGLGTDEFFSHETAVLYDPGTVGHYFERFAPGTHY